MPGRTTVLLWVLSAVLSENEPFLSGAREANQVLVYSFQYRIAVIRIEICCIPYAVTQKCPTSLCSLTRQDCGRTRHHQPSSS
ncbi:hypothetical protein V8F33_013585 [Rhypophila sp. PSN 637]